MAGLHGRPPVTRDAGGLCGRPVIQSSLAAIVTSHSCGVQPRRELSRVLSGLEDRPQCRTLPLRYEVPAASVTGMTNPGRRAQGQAMPFEFTSCPRRQAGNRPGQRSGILSYTHLVADQDPGDQAMSSPPILAGRLVASIPHRSAANTLSVDNGALGLHVSAPILQTWLLIAFRVLVPVCGRECGNQRSPERWGLDAQVGDHSAIGTIACPSGKRMIWPPPGCRSIDAQKIAPCRRLVDPPSPRRADPAGSAASTEAFIGCATIRSQASHRIRRC